jgi:hypothetical protein
VLFLAGDRARMTSDATIVIDYEAVPQFDFPQQPLVYPDSERA